MTKAKLGIKRTCTSCGLRYYDLNKSPIICPGCNAEFDPELLLKTRKSRQSLKSANVEEIKAEEEELVETKVVDLNKDADEISRADGATISDDLDFDDVEVDEEAGGLIQDEISADDGLLNNIPDSDEN